jgi:hypothetical protein
VAASAGIRAGRAPARRVSARLSSPWLLKGASILFVLGLWEWAGRIPVNIAFPTCTDTLAAFGELLVDGTFAEAYAETAGPLIVGLGLTAAGGVLAGLVGPIVAAAPGEGQRAQQHDDREPDQLDEDRCRSCALGFHRHAWPFHRRRARSVGSAPARQSGNNDLVPALAPLADRGQVTMTSYLRSLRSLTEVRRSTTRL